MTFALKSLFLSFLLNIANSEILRYQNNFISGSPYPNYLHYDAMYIREEAPEAFQDPLIEYDLTIKSPQHYQMAFLIIGKREFLLGENGVLSHKIHICRREHWEEDHLTKMMIVFDSRDNTSKIKGTFPIKSSGLYGAFFLPCGKGIYVTGEITFRNAYGYLPGTKYNFLKRCKMMAIIYAMMFTIWGFVLFNNKKNLFKHHHIITSILVFSFLEFALEDIEFHYVNNHGFRHSFIYFVSRILSVLRKTFIRVMVALVSFGYGVLEMKKRKLKEFSLKVTTAVYITFNVLCEFYLFENSRTSENVDIVLSFLKTIILVTDCAFYAIIFVGLSQTLEDLKCKERYFLRLYNYFALLLVLCLIVTTVFKFTEINYRRTKMLNPEYWNEYWWYEGGFRKIQNTVILIVVMYVWKPTKRNQYKNISDLRLEGGRLGINSERSDSYSENSEKDSDIELMIRKKKKMAEKDGDDSKDDENNEDSVKNKDEVQNKEEQNKDSLNIDEKDVEEDSDDTDDLIKLNGISVDEEEDEEPASLTKM